MIIFLCYTYFSYFLNGVATLICKAVTDVASHLATIKSGSRKFRNNWPTDIWSTTIGLQTFGLQIFGLLPHISVWDSHTSNLSLSKSLFSSNPTSTYTMILFIN